MSFSHLHVHSEYSLLESNAKISSLVDTCVKYNMPSLAVTDYGSLFGALELYFKCKEQGIRPIIGSELYLTKDHLDKTHRGRRFQKESIVLLAQNKEGYNNLCHLSTIGHQDGFYYIPRIDKELLKKYSGGLIALTGGVIGSSYKKYMAFGEEVALEEIQDLYQIFQDRLYLEYSKNNHPSYNKFLKTISSTHSIPLVATGDVHYVNKQDAIFQDVLLCIKNNRTIEDESRERLPSKEFYMKSPEEMETLFAGEEEYLDRTQEIAERCHLEFKLKNEKGEMIYHIPNPRLKKSENLKSELEYLARRGLKRHLDDNYKNDSEKKKKYEERLNKELKIINSMGFVGYFLIVYEFVHWAKKQQIPVGPGRGSGASSLVAFCLGITDLDPMPHDLLFERFLNPERVSIPDFDIDFCQEHRNRVIQHVQEQYGSEYVAQVITFGRLNTRAAIRDVGRVLAMPYSDVDAIAKLIPDRLGISIDEAIEENKALKELKETDSNISTLIDLAKGIEGVARHVSIHAAGVIIADKPILDYAPLYRGTENENVIQYDLKYAKKIGLVKFDFLGLKTLTQIKEALNLIESNRNVKVDLSDISVEDPGIYKTMNTGDTLGIFQFEGYGITDLIKKVKPSCFKDIVAINALFRPGPMDMIPVYLKRRDSKTSKYIFPELESILRETHGVIVYQEQVMLISSVIAGYSFAEADVLRRAMGEKIISEMNKQKTRFLKGASEKKYDSKKAEELFNLVAEFAKYGFNKAHAAAYCVLSAQTGWLKHYYPVEFFASLMTTELADTDKITKYMKSVKAHNIPIHPPNINHSQYEFSVQGNKIYLALGAIKGVGKLAVEDIILARSQVEGRQFKSFDHFLESIDSRKVNKKTIDSLAKAGAFDDLGYSRSQICNNYDLLMEKAENVKRDKETGQTDLFAFAEEDINVTFSDAREWTKLEELNFEKEVVGFYISQHPLDYFRYFTRFLPTKPIQKLKETSSKETVQIWGMLDEIREIVTRKGKVMGFAQLEDKTGLLDLILFSEVYIDLEKLLTKQEPILVEGKIRNDGNHSKCIVEKITPLSRYLAQFTKIEIEVSKNTVNLDRLKQTLEKHQGQASLFFKIKTNNEQDPYLSLRSKDPQGIELTIPVLEKIKSIVPLDRIRLS